MDLVGVLGLLAIVACSAAACLRGNDRHHLAPVLTLSVAAVVAACLLAQLVRPSLLLLLRRDAGAIRSGEWYRLLTSLFVQDHWLAGGLFNVSTMAVIGRLAENELGRNRWLFLYVGGGVLTELVAMRLQPIGAGNSVAYMSLAGGLLTLAVLKAGPLRRRLAGAAGLGITAALCLCGDVHGAAAAIGAALALIAPASKRDIGPT